MSRLDDLRRDYNQQHNTAIRVAGEYAAENFRRLGSWRDEDIERFVKFMTTIDNMTFGAAQTLERYYSNVARFYRVSNYVRTGVTLDDVRAEVLRLTVDSAEELWRRPFATMRTALSEGKTVKQAIELGATRASHIAKTNVQLGMGRAGRKARQANDIKFYRRVLTGMENCGLCVLASTQRYRQNDLKPIHPGCDCGEEPLFGYTEDDPLVIDQDTLDQINGYVYGSSLEDIPLGDLTNEIFVFEHGEMGPQLRYVGQNVNQPTLAEVQPNPAPPSGDPYEPVYSEEESVTVGDTEYRDGLNQEQVDAVADYTGFGYKNINGSLRDSSLLDELNSNQLETLDGQIRALDSLMESGRTTQPLIVYRGTNAEMFGYRVASIEQAFAMTDVAYADDPWYRELRQDNEQFIEMMNSLEDQEIVLDSGFFSTTKDPTRAPMFMGSADYAVGPDSMDPSTKVFIELKLPEGSPAVDIAGLYDEATKDNPVNDLNFEGMNPLAFVEEEVLVDRGVRARVTAVIPPDQVLKSELVLDGTEGNQPVAAWYVEMELITDADE